MCCFRFTVAQMTTWIEDGTMVVHNFRYGLVTSSIATSRLDLPGGNLTNYDVVTIELKVNLWTTVELGSRPENFTVPVNLFF